MSEPIFSCEDASAWITSHPLTDVSRFRRQARKLGESAVPGMIQVLENERIELHTAATFVLSMHGIKVTSVDPGSGQPYYRITMNDGTSRIVQYRDPEDAPSVESRNEASGPSNQSVNQRLVRTNVMRLLVLLMIGGAFILLAVETTGIARFIFILLAVLFVAVSLWSLAFMSIISRLLGKIRHLGPSGSPPSSDLP
jgi:hypothetical protein